MIARLKAWWAAQQKARWLKRRHALAEECLAYDLVAFDLDRTVQTAARSIHFVRYVDRHRHPRTKRFEKLAGLFISFFNSPVTDQGKIAKRLRDERLKVEAETQEVESQVEPGV